MRIEVVTIERLVYSEEADLVLAPGVEGQLGILPKHAPLISRLESGALVIRKDGRDEVLAIGGGFMEVLADRVVVLADSAELAEEIDVRRAQAARERAAQLVRQKLGRIEAAQAELALRRSLTRLRVARRAVPRRRPAGPETVGEE